MNKRVIGSILLAFLVVLGIAGVLYPRLSVNADAPQLSQASADTPEATQETVADGEPAAAAQPAEPEQIPAPDFSVLDWDGNPVNLSGYAGKPVVLNFWAHWCGACEMQMPLFNEVYEELEGEVTFLMVHEGAAVEKGKEKAVESGYAFPVVFDTDGTAAAIYGASAYPTSFFIDAEGNVQGYHIGLMDRELIQVGIDRIYTPEQENAPQTGEK